MSAASSKMFFERFFMRDTTKFLILFLTFLLGFGCAAGGAAGIAYYTFNNVTINQLQADAGININTDSVIGEYPQVYLRDMTVAGAFHEMQELGALGDTVTLNFLIDRYALILNSTLDMMIDESVRDIPLRKLFTKDGVERMFKSRYLGDIRGYEMVASEEDETVPEYWKYPDTGERIRGINSVISNFTLYDFIWGDIHADAILDELTFGEILEYTKGEDGHYYKKDGTRVSGILETVADCHLYDVQETIDTVELWHVFGYEKIDGEYYDENGKKVDGIMAIICESNIHDVPQKIEESTIADILGYEQIDGTWFDKDGKKIDGVMSVIADSNIKAVQSKIEEADLGEIMGYTYDEENEWWLDENGNKAHTFMNTISGKKIDELKNLSDELTIAEIIPEQERQNGYISLVPEDTVLTQIGPTVNNVFAETKMVDFIECGAIVFENEAKRDAFIAVYGNSTMNEMMNSIAGNLPTPSPSVE